LKSAKKSSSKKNKRPVGKSKKPAARPKQAKVTVVRTGIFGGSFDPFHNGHLNSIETVARKLQLKMVRVIPAFQSPTRAPVQGCSPQERLAMVEAGIKGHRDIRVDRREVERGGISYTIDTIRELKKENPKERMFLIIGQDQLELFDRWRQFTGILAMVDLVVTSRPGMELARGIEALPGGVRPLVDKVMKDEIVLNNGQRIYFVQLHDIDVSATEIRRRLREGKEINDLVPGGVSRYIAEHGLYQKLSKSIADFGMFTQQCAQWLADKGAVNVQAFDLRDLHGPTEFTLIASGTSTRHTSALGESLSKEIKTRSGIWPQGVEGVGEGRWVVLDYGSLIVHVFYDFLRQEYRLEDLWKKGKVIRLDLTQSPAATNPSPKPGISPT
jgi:nicotinate-nucleotide adenylyltransferase